MSQLADAMRRAGLHDEGFHLPEVDRPGAPQPALEAPDQARPAPTIFRPAPEPAKRPEPDEAPPRPRPLEKTCARCNHTKRARAFEADNRTSDGLSRYCDPCLAEVKAGRARRAAQAKDLALGAMAERGIVIEPPAPPVQETTPTIEVLPPGAPEAGPLMTLAAFDELALLVQRYRDAEEALAELGGVRHVSISDTILEDGADGQLLVVQPQEGQLVIEALRRYREATLEQLRLELLASRITP